MATRNCRTGRRGPLAMMLCSALIIVFCTPGIFARLESNPGGSNYLLAFNVVDYTPEIKKAVTSFFGQVVRPTDQIVVVTPQRAMLIAKDKLKLPKEQLIENVFKVVKADIQKGASINRTIITEMKNDIISLAAGDGNIKGVLASYGNNRKNLQVLRSNYQKRLLSYIDLFRRVQGKNHILMILQKKYRPVPVRNTLDSLRRGQYGQEVIEAFDSDYKKDVKVKQIVAALKYCKLQFHFLFLKAKQLRARNMDFVDDSGDLYEVYSKLAKATDGIKSTSTNTEPFVKEVGVFTRGVVETEVKNEEMKK